LTKSNINQTVLALASLLAVHFAEEKLGAQPAQETMASATCMVKLSNDGQKLAVILPHSDAAALQVKGFVQTLCESVFKSQSDRESYRNDICQIASSWREDLQNHFERERGERPGVLCGMAEMVVGQWNRNIK
jgi:hypothetical protein